MKNKILLIGAILLLVPLMPARDADIFGNWIAQVPFGQGTIETIFSLKAEGTKLTGTVTTPQGEIAISEGRISGDEISFVAIRDFFKSKTTLKYTGKVDLNEIKFTVEEQGGTEPPLEFIAKREFQRNQDLPLRATPMRVDPPPRSIRVPVEPPPDR